MISTPSDTDGGAGGRQLMSLDRFVALGGNPCGPRGAAEALWRGLCNSLPIQYTVAAMLLVSSNPTLTPGGTISMALRFDLACGAVGLAVLAAAILMGHSLRSYFQERERFVENAMRASSGENVA